MRLLKDVVVLLKGTRSAKDNDDEEGIGHPLNSFEDSFLRREDQVLSPDPGQ